MMPPKTIASILNNESNMKILEKLKGRAYYPRELAAEMKLSEPFIVRRLKAMEEYDIVEGRWETVNGRKVKRYYLRDVTMQLGNKGLEITSWDATPHTLKSEISMRKEAIRLLMILPIFIVGEYFYITGQTLPYMILGLLFVWYIADILAFYRNYRYISVAAGAFILGLFVFAFAFDLAQVFAHVDAVAQPNTGVGLIWLAWIIILLATFAYYFHLIQKEAPGLAADRREFFSGLDSASIKQKIFYVPMMLVWKLDEYFGLH